ncbi:M16 family metallopeptidase [Methyloversatilis thermotolerans]|uniref:M16 family metallopeptidase n=1 Tax=Methyloversatilis thermotolerans TaxID=1346290 RepID=UPI00035D9AC8|nr:pitrilysin family protein [Methyloversatilis thermotolerans]
MIRFLRGALLAAGASLLCATPASARIDIQHWTAANGARVYFVESHVLPILDVQVDFDAGSARDPQDRSGLAAMTQGLLDAAAGGMDEETLAEKFSDLGARLGGVADADRAGVALRTLASARERDGSLALLRTVLSKPEFPAAVLEREKARAIAGLREADTKPDQIGSKAFARLLYGDHPYGRSPTQESVAAITRDDVLDFYRRHYVASRAVVSIVGDVSREQAESIALQLTGDLPAGEPLPPIPAVTPPTATVERIAHPANQSHIFIGEPVTRRGDPDFFALQVGNYILGGGGFVSRLTKEVREKRGYAYSVYSYFSPQREPGPFQIGLQTQRSQAADALKVVDDTLAEFIRNGPTEAELKAAKRNLVDGYSLRLDSNRKLLDSLSVIGFYGLPLDWLNKFPERVEAVTAAQVKEAFQRRLSAAHRVKVIVAGD